MASTFPSLFDNAMCFQKTEMLRDPRPRECQDLNQRIHVLFPDAKLLYDSDTIWMRDQLEDLRELFGDDLAIRHCVADFAGWEGGCL